MFNLLYCGQMRSGIIIIFLSSGCFASSDLDNIKGGPSLHIQAMPEQICPRKHMGQKFFKEKTLHPSLKLCHYK